MLNEKLEPLKDKTGELAKSTAEKASVIAQGTADGAKRAGAFIAEHKRTAAVVAGVTAAVGAGAVWLNRRKKV